MNVITFNLENNRLKAFPKKLQELRIIELVNVSST